MLNPTLVRILIQANNPYTLGKGINWRDERCERTIVRSEKLRYTEKLAGLSGLKFLGKGAFASAWLMGDGRVLKIGSTQDDAYEFNVWCKANRGAPGVPDVYEVRRVAGGWYCIMEHVTTAKSLGSRKPDDVVWEAVHAFSRDSGSSCDDMHAGNWGFTDDGRTVVIDPSSDSSCVLPPAEQAKRMPPKRQYGPQRPGAARWH